MTTDLEQRLARAMEDAPFPEGLDVDVDAVLGQGRRRVRRRRTALAGGVVATVVAAAFALPALIPSSSQREYPATPAASPTTSVREFSRDQVFTAPGGGSGTRTGEGRWRVAFDPSSREITVTDLPEGADTGRIALTLPLDRIPRTAGAPAGVFPLGEGAVLVVVPADASEATVVRHATPKDDPGLTGPDAAPLDGAGVQVGIASTSPAAARSITAVRWRVGDRMADSAGGTYRTVRLPGTPSGLLWSGADGRVGVVGDGGAMEFDGIEERAGVLSTSAQSPPTQDGAARWTVQVYAVIPRGGTDPAFVWPAGWRGTQTSAVPLPGRSGTFVIGHATAASDPEAAQSQAVRIAWTSPDGRRVSRR